MKCFGAEESDIETLLDRVNSTGMHACVRICNVSWETVKSNKHRINFLWRHRYIMFIIYCSKVQRTLTRIISCSPNWIKRSLEFFATVRSQIHVTCDWKIVSMARKGYFISMRLPSIVDRSDPTLTRFREFSMLILLVEDLLLTKALRRFSRLENSYFNQWYVVSLLIKDGTDKCDAIWVFLHAISQRSLTIDITTKVIYFSSFHSHSLVTIVAWDC